MEPERTEQQTTENARRSAELSLKRTSPPSQVPGYRIEEFLGAGAYGEVWVGIDENTSRRVAIKFYTHRGAVDWSLLSREVEKLVYLSADRYVVQLLDVGWDADPPYYVMDYIENGSLNDHIVREGPMPVEDGVELFREVAIGLVHAHDKGILHCDLKPANVLLDTDHKPRLADFGQSRLTHEQTPSLGTMFFMAPEQADLEAVPDARWDVYALGALFFTAVVGEPPYRSEDSMRRIDFSDDLGGRLQRYRETIRSAPRPMRHRNLAGMDRQMADIIDRCLAPSPSNRYHNVQEVLSALKQRERRRSRRPQLVLGLVGPLLILLIMSFFSWRIYHRAVDRSLDGVIARARETNQYAAQAVANRAAQDIQQYFNTVESVARDANFLDLVKQLADAEQASLEQLSDPNKNAEPLPARERFIKTSAASALQAKLEALLRDPEFPGAASWFVCDPQGTQLAASFATPATTSTVGRNYSWRTYFHDGPDDLVKEAEQGEPRYSKPTQHLQATRLSSPFQSKATNKWKIAIATPLHANDPSEFQGVVALTVDLGVFLKSVEGGPTFFAALIDSRPGVREGMILQHPSFDRLGRLPDRYSRYRVTLTDETTLYRDPLGAEPDAEHYDRVWIVAQTPVLLARGQEGGGDNPSPLETGLTVLVQEDYEEAVTPVRVLGEQLMRESLVALSVFLMVVVGLWAYVTRILVDGSSPAATNGQGRTHSTPMFELSTLPSPERPSKSARDL